MPIADKPDVAPDLLESSERLIATATTTATIALPAARKDGEDMKSQVTVRVPPVRRREARLIVSETIAERSASGTVSDFDAREAGEMWRAKETAVVGDAFLHPVDAEASPGYRFGKRVLDIVGAGLALLVLAPVFLLLAVLIRIGSPGPVFHRRRVLAQQKYDGKTALTYDAFKFRTMIVNADGYLQANPQLLAEYSKDYKLSNDPRVTRVGAPLRRLSLDELPQLWNILCGQMSLVGPRMISPPELEMYGADAARLLAVKPGLTGLWQVSGRTNIAYQERVHLDMYYIENRSLWLDIEILVRTVGCVLARRGAV